MKWKNFLFCLAFGHNKILEKKTKNGYSTYFTLCTQCERKWNHKQLSEKPVFKIYRIKMKGHGKTILVKNIPQIIPSKKERVNIYAL